MIVQLYRVTVTINYISCNPGSMCHQKQQWLLRLDHYIRCPVNSQQRGHGELSVTIDTIFISCPS